MHSSSGDHVGVARRCRRACPPTAAALTKVRVERSRARGWRGSSGCASRVCGVDVRARGRLADADHEANDEACPTEGEGEGAAANHTMDLGV